MRLVAGLMVLILGLPSRGVAQNLNFSGPQYNVYVGQVRDRVVARDSLERIWGRAQVQYAGAVAAIRQLDAQYPPSDPRNQGGSVAARRAALLADIQESQSLMQRTQSRLGPVYQALGQDSRYIGTTSNPELRQAVGTLLGTVAFNVDPIWLRTAGALVTPAAGAAAVGATGAGSAGGAAAAEAAAAELAAAEAAAVAASGARGGTTPTGTTGAGGTNLAPTPATGVGNVPLEGRAIAPPGSGQGSASGTSPGVTSNPVPAVTAPQAGSPATGVAGEVAAAEAAAVAGTTAGRSNLVWTMEANPSTNTMWMHARDAVTRNRATGVAPVPTSIPTGADAAAVTAEGASRTLGQLRRSAWVAEPMADGASTFRAVDWRTGRPIEGHMTIPGQATGGAVPAGTPGAGTSTSAATGTNGAASGTGAAAATRSVSELQAMRWTAEPNPATGNLVLRARDATTNLHARGFTPVETTMPISGEGAMSRAALREVVFQARPNASTGAIEYLPVNRTTGQPVEGISPVTQPGGGRASAVAGEATAAEATASRSLRSRLPPMREIASSAVKWTGLSLGITLASEVGNELIQSKREGRPLNWSRATEFLTDWKFWGGTAGGFVGSLGGSVLASMVPGGPFVKALLSIGGASLGYQVGSGNLGKTDWMGLAVTTVGAAAGTALGMTMGPVGAVVGGIAGQMLSQWVYNKLKARSQQPGTGPAVQDQTGPIQQGPYVQQQQSPDPGLQQQQQGTVGPGPMQIQAGPGQFPPGGAGFTPGQVPPGYGPGGGVPGQGPVDMGALQGTLAEMNQRLAIVYQELTAASQSGNRGIAYQKMIEYQSLQARIAALRRQAVGQAGFGNHHSGY